MKVLLVSHRPDYIGGIASWTKRMLKLQCNEIEFCLVDSSPINRDAFKNTKISFKDETYRSLTIWKNEIKALSKDKMIQIVHTNIPCTLFGQIRETITCLISKAYGKKFVLHCHCTVPNVVKSNISKSYFRVLLKLCDGIVVLNEQSKTFVELLGGKNVRVIPNFVMEDELDFSEKKNVSSSINNALYVGGVTPEKGCDIIIEAAKACPDITFHLVGLVSSEIKCMKRPSNVKLYGNVDENKVKQFLKMADVFLFLSRFYGEGFSCALTEAMASGLPCIVSDWAANRDMLEGRGGIVLKNPTARDVSHAIIDLSTQVKSRKEMSEWNQKKVKGAYTDKIVLDMYKEFYEMVACGR